MIFTIDDISGGVRVRFEEPRLDAAISIRFKDRLREVTARHGPLILLDLSRVDFMDSSGLGAILAIRRTLTPPRRIELTGLTPNVVRVFKLTRMDTIFTIHSEGPDAVPSADNAASDSEVRP